MGQISQRKKGRKQALIFIDRWYGRWLEVGGSGLEWNEYPPAHGRRFTAPKILRRRIPSFHRRKKPDHHPFPLAQTGRRRVHHSSRAASSISRHHVGGGVRPHERAGRISQRDHRARSPDFFAPAPFARGARRLRSPGPARPAGISLQTTWLEGRGRARGRTGPL